jgi:hypothetical protein
MQLSEFKAIARPRSEWQAIDLGIVMARAWYFKLLVAWAVPAVLVYSVLLLFFWDSTWISIFIIWWCKPLWERPILFIASRQLFDEQVSPRQVVRQYLSMIKTDWFLWLSLRRFSIYRAFDMPVTLLEGLKGKERQKRLGLLHRRFSSGASWLLITLFHIEGFLLFGFLTGLYFLLPQGVELNWNELVTEQETLSSHLYNTFWVLTMALIAPFYVCCGFFLYLQRRIDLEGWDIEINFRQLAKRRSSAGGGRPRLAVIGLGLAVLMGVLDTNIAYAQDESAFPSAQTRAKADIQAVLEGEDFRRIETEEGWRFKDKQDEEEATIPDWLIEFAEWLDKHGGFFSALADFFRSGASILEFLLWISFISIVIYVLYRYRQQLRQLVGSDRDQGHLDVEPPEVLFGLDVTKDSLPKDVIAAAQSQWQSGQQRQAIGILLRSSIIKLIHDHRCPFQEGHTELECAQIVNQAGLVDPSGGDIQKIAGYFQALTRQWLSIAYAHKDCQQEQFQSLCEGWTEAFRHA